MQAVLADLGSGCFIDGRDGDTKFRIFYVFRSIIVGAFSDHE